MTRNVVALVDVDDQGSWRNALPTAIDQARHTGARLHVLTVVPDAMLQMTIVAQIIPEGYERKLIDDARQRLAGLLAEQATDGVELDQVVRHGSVHKEVLHFARDVDADLIVMGARKPEVRDYLIGPNAAHIVSHADCSVWVVRD